MRYAFIEQKQSRHSVRLLCHVLRVHPSGYYAWKTNPVCVRERDNRHLLPKLKQAWLESRGDSPVRFKPQAHPLHCFCDARVLWVATIESQRRPKSLIS